MSVRSVLVVQSHREACSLRIGTFSRQRGSKEHTLAYDADIPQLQKHSCDDRRHC